MPEPPSAGAVQVTEAVPPPEPDATPMVGAPGTVAGMAEDEATEAAPVPTALVAFTVKV